MVPWGVAAPLGCSERASMPIPNQPDCCLRSRRFPGVHAIPSREPSEALRPVHPPACVCPTLGVAAGRDGPRGTGWLRPRRPVIRRTVTRTRSKQAVSLPTGSGLRQCPNNAGGKPRVCCLWPRTCRSRRGSPGAAAHRTRVDRDVDHWRQQAPTGAVDPLILALEDENEWVQLRALELIEQDWAQAAEQ